MRNAAIILQVFLILILFVTPCSQAGENADSPENETKKDNTRDELPEGVIAVVNGREIRESEFDSMLRKRMGPQMLDWLIRTIVVEQEAEKLGIEISEEELNKTAQDKLKRFYASRGGKKKAEEFLDGLFFPPAVFEFYNLQNARFELMLEKIIAKRLSSEERVKAVYEKRYGKDKGAFVRIVQVTVKTEEQAVELVERINAGDKIEEIAGTETNISKRLRESAGDTGYFCKGGRYGEVEKQAFALDEGKVSGPIKGRFAWHVIKVVDRKEPGEINIEDVRDEIVAELTSQIPPQMMRSVPGELIEQAEVKWNRAFTGIPEKENRKPEEEPSGDDKKEDQQDK